MMMWEVALTSTFNFIGITECRIYNPFASNCKVLNGDWLNLNLINGTVTPFEIQNYELPFRCRLNGSRS